MAFRQAPRVQKVLLRYLAGLSADSLTKESNFLIQVNDVIVAKKVVDAYLNDLSKKELLTADNLIFISQLYEKS